MKLLLFVMMLFFSLLNSVYAQSESIQILSDSTYFYVNKTIKGEINNYEKDSIYILDYEIDKKLIDNDANEKGHFDIEFDKKGSYILSLLKFKKDGTKELINTIEIDINDRTKLNITRIEINNYYPIKPSGRSWDYTISGTLPDVFINVSTLSNPTNSLSTVNHRFENLKRGESAVWNFKDLHIVKENFEKGLNISVYDKDSVSSNDYMGGIELESIMYGEPFDKEEGSFTKEIDENGRNKCKITVYYKWE